MRGVGGGGMSRRIRPDATHRIGGPVPAASVTGPVDEDRPRPRTDTPPPEPRGASPPPRRRGAGGSTWRRHAAGSSLPIRRSPTTASSSSAGHDPGRRSSPAAFGSRRCGELVDGAAGAAIDDDDVTHRDLQFGPPMLRPPTFRDFYAFEQHVGTMWNRRGIEIPEAWYRLPIFYFRTSPRCAVPASRSGRRAAAPSSTSSWRWRGGRHAGRTTSTRARRGGNRWLLIVNDWSARDLQRDETTVRLGPAKGKDFALDGRPVDHHAGRAGGRCGGRAMAPISR